jgi:hypothetical protein
MMAAMARLTVGPAATTAAAARTIEIRTKIRRMIRSPPARPPIRIRRVKLEDPETQRPVTTVPTLTTVAAKAAANKR